MNPFHKAFILCNINMRGENVAYAYTIRLRWLYSSARACSRTTHFVTFRIHTHGGYRWMDEPAESRRYPFLDTEASTRRKWGCLILNDRVNEKQTTIQSISHPCTKKEMIDEAPSAKVKRTYGKEKKGAACAVNKVQAITPTNRASDLMGVRATSEGVHQYSFSTAVCGE